MRDVVLVIPNWNGEAHLRRLFPSLAAQTLRPARILVVDNGSTDGSIAHVRSQGADVLALPRNLGFAAAVNQGIAASGETLIAILNNDVTLAPDYLQLLAASLEGGASFASGKIYQPGGNNLLDATWDILTRAALPLRCGHGLPDSAAWNEPRSISLVPFTAALFERRVFEQLGPLDERFESYLEDVDFGLRCALSGLSGRYVPAARAEHWGSATLGVWHPETVRRMARNQLYLVAKHYPRQWPLSLGWPVVVGQLLWGLAALKQGRGVSWLKGKIEGLRGYAQLRGDGPPASCGELTALLLCWEQELVELQMKIGPDRFWSWYFRWTS